MSISLLVLSTPGLINLPAATAAGAGTIRQEINILDSTYTATNVAISSSEFSRLDPTQYSGTTAYYFEIVASATAGSTGNISLRRQGTSTDDSTIALSSLGTSTGRYRSASFTPPSSATEYFINADAAGSSKTVTIKAARIIIIQASSPMTATETQLEIGSKVTGLTNTTAAPLTNPKYWQYTANSWDNSPTFYAEATHKVVNATVTITLQEDDGSYGSWTDKVTVASSAATSSTRSRVAFTPVDGRHYRISALRAAGSGTRTYDIYNAKIIVDQSGTSIDPVSKLQPQYLLLNTADSNSTTEQGYPTLYDSAEWSGTQRYRFAIDSDNASNAAKLVDASNSNANISGSGVGGTNQSIGSPAYIQGANAFDSSSSAGLMVSSFPSSVMAGDLIVVALGGLTSNYSPTITDSQGNTYTKARTVVNTGIPYQLDVFYTIAGSSGANTVTADPNGTVSSFRRLAIHEYAGANSLDVTAANSGSSGVPDSGNATTTHDNEIIFGWGINNSGIFSPGTGFTARQAVTSELTEDKLDMTAGSYNAFFPTDTSPWAVIMAAFYNSSGTPSVSLSSGHDIDTSVINTTGTIAAARIIVDVTLPASIVSVSVSDGNISYGILATASNKDTTSGGLDDTQTATNNGNTTEDFNIKGQDTANWTLGGSTGANQYTHSFCSSGSGSPDPCDSTPSWTTLTNSYQALASNISAGSTQKFDLKLGMPTSTSNYGQQSVDVTIQAVEH